jgi:hypothetical protein
LGLIVTVFGWGSWDCDCDWGFDSSVYALKADELFAGSFGASFLGPMRRSSFAISLLREDGTGA